MPHSSKAVTRHRRNPLRGATTLAAATIAAALFSSQARAVDIVFDNTSTLIAGSDCTAGARYRLGTSSSYGGKDLDVIVEITGDNNDFTSQIIGGVSYHCLGVFEDDPGDPKRLSLVGSDGNDNGDSTEPWSTDLRLEIVEKGTETPITVDRLLVTVFDLDIDPGKTGTDGILTSDSAAIYLDESSDVSVSATAIPGPQGLTYKRFIAGTNLRDCTATTQSGCRAAIAATGTSALSLRVFNNKSDPTSPRLFQFSLTASDFDALDLGSDQGDAPVSYGIASAAIASTPLLGQGLPPDTDASSQAGNDALGDDTDDSRVTDFDDDDGVTLGGADLSDQSLTIGAPRTLNVSVYGSGRLNAFFDWNRDGDFDDDGEHVITERTLTTGRHDIQITPPATATSGTSYARFRYCASSNDCNVPSGQANSGETEDYRIVLTTGNARSGEIKTGLDGGGSMGWLTLLALPACYLRRRTRCRQTSKPLLPVTALLLGLGATTTATAENSPDDRHFDTRVYAGVGIGYSRLRPDTSETDYTVGDDNDLAKSLHLGVDFSKHWTVEAYVVDLGEAEILCKSNCDRAGNIGYQHFGISAIGYFLNQRDGGYYGGGYDDEGLYRREGLSAFGRLGIGKMNNDTDLNYKRLNDIHMQVGAGVEYGWRNGLAARAELISYDTDALAASMGLIKRFGDNEPYLQGPPVVPPELEAPPTGTPPATPAATPAEKPVRKVMRKVVRIRLPRLYFAVDDHHLSPLAQRKLLDLVRTMKRYPRLKLEIRGYTDATASTEYNLNLSLRRAAAVRKFMARHGIPASRLRLAALSENDPVADNSTPEGRAKNRRVEFRIIR